MHILFFHYSMQHGGAERTISLLSNYAAQHGDTVTIITMDDQQSFYALHRDVTHIRLNIGSNSGNIVQALNNNLHSLHALRAAYLSCQPDIVICFGPNTILLSHLARGKAKYKLVGSERANPYLSTPNFWSRNKRRISKMCDGFLFQTAGARNYYPKTTQKKSIILPNSIVSADFADLDRPWEERKNICAVGRLIAGKCFDDLLTAFVNVHKRYPNVKLDLYGDGPMRSQLERMSDSLGIQESVVFHNCCNTILNEYSMHKVFAMSNEEDGMPNVLMEALASGCACVASDCDFGPSELIRDGENGFLVPVHDTDAMADRLCRLLEDDALCRRFSQAALSIRQTHDVETIGANFRDYLSSL